MPKVARKVQTAAKSKARLSDRILKGLRHYGALFSFRLHTIRMRGLDQIGPLQCDQITMLIVPRRKTRALFFDLRNLRTPAGIRRKPLPLRLATPLIFEQAYFPHGSRNLLVLGSKSLHEHLLRPALGQRRQCSPVQISPKSAPPHSNLNGQTLRRGETARGLRS